MVCKDLDRCSCGRGSKPRLVLTISARWDNDQCTIQAVSARRMRRMRCALHARAPNRSLVTLSLVLGQKLPKTFHGPTDPASRESTTRRSPAKSAQAGDCMNLAFNFLFPAGGGGGGILLG